MASRTVTAGPVWLVASRVSPVPIYRLGDGDRGVRLVGCRDRSAVFNGAILTTGPRAVDLEVVVAGKQLPARVAAYAS